MTINDDERITLIKNIDAIYSAIKDYLQYIHLSTQDIAHINELIEQRFSLLLKLLQDSSDDNSLKHYLISIINSDEELMTHIQTEKKKIGESLINMNQLKNYMIL